MNNWHRRLLLALLCCAPFLFAMVAGKAEAANWGEHSETTWMNADQNFADLLRDDHQGSGYFISAGSTNPFSENLVVMMGNDGDRPRFQPVLTPAQLPSYLKKMSDNRDLEVRYSATIEIYHNDFMLIEVFGGTQPIVERTNSGASYDPFTLQTDWGLFTGWNGISFYGVDKIGGTVSNLKVQFREVRGPKLERVGVSAPGKQLSVGKMATITLQFDKAVHVDTTAKIPFNTGGKATYLSGDGTSAVTYRYIVGEGEMARPDKTTYPGNSGAYLDFQTGLGGILSALDVVSLSGNDINATGDNWKATGFVSELETEQYEIDGYRPIIQVEASTVKNGPLNFGRQYLREGDNLIITVKADEPVYLPGGAGQIAFDNGAVAAYKSGNGTDTFTYEYTVQSGKDTNRLQYDDFVGNIADIGMRDDFGNIPKFNDNYTPSLSIDNGKTIVVDTIKPRLLFHDDGNPVYEKSQRTEMQLIETGSGLIDDLPTPHANDQYRYQWTDSPVYPTDWTTAKIGTGASLETSIKDVNYDWYVHAKLVDLAGNIADPVTSRAFKLDNIAPETMTIAPNDSGNKYVGLERMNPVVTVHDTMAGIDDLTTEYQWVPRTEEPSDFSWRHVANGTAVMPPQFPEHGVYHLYVRVSDKAGNKRQIVSDTFYLDVTPPNVTLTNADERMTLKGEHNPFVTVVDGDSAMNMDDPASRSRVSYYWSPNVSDASPDWHEMSTAASLSTTDWPVPLEGVVYLHIRASDMWGNEQIVYWPFNVDHQAPDARITVPASLTNTMKIGKARVEAFDRNGLSKLQYIWKTGATPPASNAPEWTTFASGATLDKQADGDWYLFVKAVDTFGNEKIASSPVYHLDNTAPKPSDYAVQAESHVNRSNAVVKLTAAAPDSVTYRVYDRSGDERLSGIMAESTVSFVLPVATEQTEGHAQPFAIELEDEAGNRSDRSQLSFAVVYDTTAPSAELEYVNGRNAGDNVMVRLKHVSDNASAADKLVFPDGESHTFRDNGSYTFRVVDEAGNELELKASVEDMETVAPTASVEALSGVWPSRELRARIDAEDNVTDDDAIRVYYQWSRSGDPIPADDGGWLESPGNHADIVLAEGAADGEWVLHAKAVDLAGNVGFAIGSPLKLDRTAPDATISYSTDLPTANTVTAHISFNEPNVTVTNTTYGELYRDFTANGAFAFEYVDAAGNTGTATATVSTIDPLLPKADVALSESSLTNQDVDVTIASADSRYELDEFVFADGMGAALRSSVTGAVYVTQAVYSVSGNGTFSFKLKDTQGEQDDQPVTVEINNIDKTAPTGTIVYSSTGWTRGSVTAAVYTADRSKVTITSGGGESVKTFDDNGSYTFRFVDAAGNVGEATATVATIDRTAATVTGVVYAPSVRPTNKPVTVTLNATDNSGETVAIANNGGDNTYTFNDNGSFTFWLRDRAGNETDYTVTLTGIDRKKPTATVSYSGTTRTNQDVVATITATDDGGNPVIITSAGGNTHTFVDNGTFVFTYRDEAGNEGELTTGVDWIDKTAPKAVIHPSETKPTQNDVELTLEADPSAIVVNNGGSPVMTATANGVYTFDLEDALGNASTVSYEVTNIDRTAPVVGVLYSIEKPTNKSVVASVYGNEPFRVLNNDGSKERVFDANGTFTFEVEDEAGNRSSVTAVVSNIDRTPPTVTVEYSTTAMTNRPVIATLASDEPIRVLNNFDKLDFTFDRNGYYSFVIEDMAGNRTTARAEVRNIDVTPPTIRFVRPYVIANAATSLADSGIVLSDVEAFDDQDGLIAFVYLDVSALNVATPGDYEVIYRAADRAGNETVVKRTVKIIPKGQFAVFINGRNEPNHEYVIHGNNADIQVFNPVEQYEIRQRTGAGKLKPGDLKREYTPLDNRNNAGKLDYQANRIGWTTLYFRDLNGNADYFNLFFLGSE